VCEYLPPQRDVYIQWGRQSCSNSHTLVYKGIVMGTHYSQRRSTSTCVDFEMASHNQSQNGHQYGNLLYTAEWNGADTSNYKHNVEVGCAMCAGDVGRTVFTRYGSRTCPLRSQLLYEGWMVAPYYGHRGGGANALCLHSTFEEPEGSSTSNHEGDLLYVMEYENTGAIDKNHDKDPACVVCELDRFESVYVEWGRSTSCSEGRQTLYSGFIMAGYYSHSYRSEFLCVDAERAPSKFSSNGNHNANLYTTEIEEDDGKYKTNVEVGCSVCVADH